MISQTQGRITEECLTIEDNEICTHTNPTDFLISYFNFWYYIGVCPFRFQFCTQTQKFKILKSSIQRIYCGFVVVMTTLYLLSCVRSIYIEHDLTKEMNYFAISKVCGNLVTCWCFFITVWMYTTEFEKLINKYLDGTYTYKSCSNYVCTYKVKVFAPLFILMVMIISLAFVALNIIEDHNWDLRETYLKIVHFAKMLPFASSSNLIGSTQKLIFTVYVASFTLYNIVDIACQILVVISAFSLISALTALENILPYEVLVERFRQYSLLKTISRLNNKAVGLAVFGVVFGYIPVFIHCIPEIIQPKGPFACVNNLLSVCLPFAFLILAAKITNKASTVFGDSLNIDENIEDTSYQMSLFIFELLRQEIGFSSAGFIKLTSSFLGAVISLVLTFAVVIIQFNTAKV